MIASKTSRRTNASGLVYSSDNQPGFTRRRWGRGFQYLNENKKKITCKESLRRIKQLVIPPGWEEVWICKATNGHLQSTGRDLRRRKQYIYHPQWVAYRQAEKFSRLLDFAEGLPCLRETVAAHLKNKTWNRQKVLALAVKVLDQYHIRVGNKQYRKRNGTYGLTTLRRKHIELEKDELRLSYKAKSNVLRKINIDHPKLTKLIRQCSELPGYELFSYKDNHGKTQALESSEVNAYIQQIIGDDFSAKDFRTWAGTCLAVKYLPDAKEVVAKNLRRKLEKAVVKLVAQELGNTIAVCQKYYIHPKVLKFVGQDHLPSFIPETNQYLEAHEVMTKWILQKESEPGVADTLNSAALLLH